MIEHRRRAPLWLWALGIACVSALGCGSSPGGAAGDDDALGRATSALAVDQCPTDPDKAKPGKCGCGVPDTDTDGDGKADCIDQCPTDPNKTKPGKCGCNAADTDGDGFEDCIDDCPTDPGKKKPGVCGCGVADLDTDGDSLCDAADSCPGVFNPDQIDTDLDGLGDACDADTSGVPALHESTRVLVMLANRSVVIVRRLHSVIEDQGGHVRGVLGISALIADLPPGVGAGIAADPDVQLVTSDPIDPPPDGSTPSDAIGVWNRLVAGDPPASPGPIDELPAEIAPQEAPDLPATPAEKAALEAQFAASWATVKLGLPVELQPNCPPSTAGVTNTSLYLSGSVAVGVFYVPGTIGGWCKTGFPCVPGENIGNDTPEASTDAWFAYVVSSLDAFVGMQPTAGLSFQYVNEVDGNGNPLPLPSNQLLFDNTLRNTYCTDWAFMIIVSNGGTWAHATMPGPTLWMDVTSGEPGGFFDDVLRHETAHVFGAWDQYPDPPTPNPLHSVNTRWGYLRSTNGNAFQNDGLGYFAGEGEYQCDLMASWCNGPVSFPGHPNVNFYNSYIGAYTAGWLGWHDSDGDGVLDVRDTYPNVDPPSVTYSGACALTFTGTAVDKPLLNEDIYHGNVSINTIRGVQYRIIRGTSIEPWQDASPSDGNFNSVSEGFTFTTPTLPDGTYTVQIAATNSQGNVEQSVYSQQVIVSGGCTSDCRPFGSLSVTPKRAQAGTPRVAVSSASRDLETPLASLACSISWDGALGPPYPCASPPPNPPPAAFNTVGAHTVTLLVSDGTNVHQVSQTVMQEAYDTKPTLKFVTTPENRHFTLTSSYQVQLNVFGSSDAENDAANFPLWVQWNDDCDDVVWTPPTTNMQRTVTATNFNPGKSERRCFRVRLIDASFNTTVGDRYVWVVPYNHAPLVTSAIFTANGPDYTMAVNATDADSATTWDGLLEYRFDYDADGTWDTTYGPSSTIFLPGPYRYTVVAEVKDRFHARAGWSQPVPPQPCCGNNNGSPN